MQVRLEVPENRALDGRGDMLGARETGVEQDRDIPHGFPFQEPQRRASRLAQNRRIEFLGFAAAGEKQPPRLESRRAMQQREFQRLPGEFLRFIQIARQFAKSFRLLPLETDHDERVALDRRSGLKVNFCCHR